MTQSNPSSVPDEPSSAEALPGVVKKPIVPRFVPLLLVLVVVGSVLLSAGYFTWQWLQQREMVIAELQNQLGEQRLSLQNIQDLVQNEKFDRERQGSAVQENIAQIRQRLDSNHKRLKSLASTDRDDWRLAEAEYLLQLANQRLVIERDTHNAEALLTSADGILRDLNDVDLFPVRKEINRDLTALKLITKLDREGIYLQLTALTEQILSLPLIPVRQSGLKDAVEEDVRQKNMGVKAKKEVSAVTRDLAVDQSRSWTDAAKQSFNSALAKVYGLIRVRHHDLMLEPLLPPDGHAYLQQNFRFMLERAQLAMLREEDVIYGQSLQQARDWLVRYYSLAENMPQFDSQLAQLQKQKVSQALPDISLSLERLQAYIQRRHKLAYVDKTTQEDSP